MTHRLTIIAAVVTAGLIAAPASFAQSTQPRVTGQPPASSAAKQALNQQDKTFVSEAALGGMAEVKLGKNAQKSANPDVKSFADRMVLEHTGANEQLTTIATGLGMKMPKALDSEHERMREGLAALHGKAFDEQYMRAMVEDHNKAVKLFQQEERTGDNADLKQFAQKMLPTLEEHQKMALDVSHRLSQTRSK
jgi:putative membrane protein